MDPSTRVLHIDFETQSAVDLTKTGSHVYSLDPSTRVLCMAYGFDLDPPKIWISGDPFPCIVVDHVRRGGTVAAWNAAFEMDLWNNCLVNATPDLPGLLLLQVYDVMVQAAAVALPRSLGACAAALGVTEKDETGRLVMLQLCKPRRPSKDNPDTYYTPEKYPDKYRTLYNYCLQDVVVQQAIWSALPPLTTEEQRLYTVTMSANFRGIPIDANAVMAMLTVIKNEKADLEAEITAITGINGTQVKQLAQWIVDQGVSLDVTDKGAYKLDKATMSGLLMRNIPDNVRRVVRLRQELSKSSTAKYSRMLSSLSPDGTVKHNMVHHGCSTGRCTGSALQALNFPRPTIAYPDKAIDWAVKDPDIIPLLYDSPMNVAASALRGMIKAPPGRLLVVADYSQIESRVLCALADQSDALDEFREGLDPYRTMAAYMYNKSYDQIDKGSQERQVAKSAVLGCGFGMGAPALMRYAEAMGVTLSENEATIAVSSYREKHHCITDFWYTMERAAISAIDSPGKTQYANQIAFRYERDYLKMRLPSGRRISYYKPFLRDKVTPWGQTKPHVYYMGVNTWTRKWSECSTYGGDLAQSATQATARDLLYTAWWNIDQYLPGYDVILSVYDEIVCIVDEQHADVGALTDVMEEVPNWAAGLPVKAEGYAAKRYRK